MVHVPVPVDPARATILLPRRRVCRAPVQDALRQVPADPTLVQGPQLAQADPVPQPVPAAPVRVLRAQLVVRVAQGLLRA